MKNKNEEEQFLNELNELKKTSPECPVCLQNKWIAAPNTDAISPAFIFDNPNGECISLGAALFPAFIICCSNCGYMQVFSRAVLKERIDKKEKNISQNSENTKKDEEHE